MVKLQEERSRGMSVSSPDIVLSQSTMNGEKGPVSANSSASSQLQDARERRISHSGVGQPTARQVPGFFSSNEVGSFSQFPN